MDNALKVATWNVNSIKARHDAVTSWLERNRPDILCLQELKTDDDGFPFEELRRIGYHAVTNPQKTYNGVAILALEEPLEVTRGMGDDDPQARVISAKVGNISVVCAYVPNGSEVGSDKWGYKLDWLARFRAWYCKRFKPVDDVIVFGDFNMVFDELDMRNPGQWEGTVIWNERVRKEFPSILECGLVDVFRAVNPSSPGYSWWDYRMAGFRRNDGIRLDYVLATSRLANLAIAASVDRDERAAERPSDHAPVIVEFKLQ